MRRLVKTGRCELSVHKSNKIMKLTTGADLIAAIAGSHSALATGHAAEEIASAAPRTTAPVKPKAMRPRDQPIVAQKSPVGASVIRVRATCIGEASKKSL